MGLHARQKQWLDEVYPGLISSVEALGEGAFESRVPDIDAVSDTHIDGIDGLWAVYTLKRHFIVDIRVSLDLKPGAAPYKPRTGFVLADWQPSYYRLHYGKRVRSKAAATDETFFRFDMSASEKPHVHVFPDPDRKPHPLAHEATPDTTNLDPRIFVSWIAKFRKDGIHPVKWKTQ